MSGFGPQGIRLLDLGNGIYILSSIFLQNSLPNYRAWYLDELKTQTVIRHIEGEYSGSIEKLWENLDLWQREFEQKHKEIPIS